MSRSFGLREPAERDRVSARAEEGIKLIVLAAIGGGGELKRAGDLGGAKRTDGEVELLREVEAMSSE